MNNEPETQEVLNVFEAAAYLRLQPKTVRGMAKDERLPAKKVGREWRFLKSSLEQWLSGDYPEREQRPAGILTNKGNKPCRSLSVVTPTGSIFGTKDADYEKVLGL
tara:strand:+ start:39834 stop:40151 length:318 start_codon:yes stop_codon:yes gene_type:complete